MLDYRAASGARSLVGEVSSALSSEPSRFGMTKPSPALPPCPNCSLDTCVFDTRVMQTYSRTRHFVRCTACGAKGTHGASRPEAIARLKAGQWLTPFDEVRIHKEWRARGLARERGK